MIHALTIAIIGLVAVLFRRAQVEYELRAAGQLLVRETETMLRAETLT